MTTVQSGYVDENGRARLRSSIVGFIDLLGFSQLVTSTERKEDSQKLLDMIVDSIRDSRTHVRDELAADFAARPADWAVKFFSDNLVVGCPFEEAAGSFASAAWFVVRCVQHYQLRMILNGLFLRGGLSQGLVCLTDEVIFGPGLIECYQLESKVSVVPRVILSSSFSNALISSCRKVGKQAVADCGEFICRDVDGQWFVNYLQAASKANRIDWGMIERHKESILSSLASTTRHDILPKYGWACRYHNMFCHWNRNDPEYQERYRIDRVDERSTICRLGEISVSDASST